MNDGSDKSRQDDVRLIDLFDDERRASGVDSTWWARSLGVVQVVLPGRFRGLPPLFYPPAIVGSLWGAMFLLLKLPGRASASVAEGHALVGILGALLIASAVAGIVQGIGTLCRRKWGLVAAQAWFALTILEQCIRLATPGTYAWSYPAGALLNTLIAGGFAVYYYNRRAWFGWGHGSQ